MNLSGEAIRQLIDFYKISIDKLLIIYDDISLEVGKIRIRDKGSAGGHNGIKSIIENLNTEVFARIKIGVGQPKGDLVRLLTNSVLVWLFTLLHIMTFSMKCLANANIAILQALRVTAKLTMAGWLFINRAIIHLGDLLPAWPV